MKLVSCEAIYSEAKNMADHTQLPLSHLQKLMTCCDVHIYTQVEDGGHFIPFNQNICRSKQDMKKEYYI